MDLLLRGAVFLQARELLVDVARGAEVDLGFKN